MVSPRERRNSRSRGGVGSATAMPAARDVLRVGQVNPQDARIARDLTLSPHHRSASRDRRGSAYVILLVRANFVENLGSARGATAGNSPSAADRIAGAPGEPPAACLLEPDRRERLLRFAEAAIQVRAPAGETQVDGARAPWPRLGGGSQFCEGSSAAKSPDPDAPSARIYGSADAAISAPRRAS